MVRFRSAPSQENFTRTASRQSPQAMPIMLAPAAAPLVRRQLSRESGRALEILGHAIEYLADEYAEDVADKGPLGSADPRVEAIQILKALNRSIYLSGPEVQPAFQRLWQWLLGSRVPNNR
jgi:hypothetical protein